MAQSIKRRPFKLQDPRSDPQHPHKKLIVAVCVCNPSASVADRLVPGVSGKVV